MSATPMPAAQAAAAPVLELVNVSKSFGPVTVISDVTIGVYAGQVHVLLGENGAGKSTLIKMMCGIYQPDSGQLTVDGTPVRLDGVKAAEALGIATIHQELNLVPSLSVAENVLMGRLPSRAGVVDKPRMRRLARQALARIGLDIDVNTPVSELGVARQQLVEIAKALSLDARILILDEPTAALTAPEVDQLFAVVDDLRRSGVAMVFISHHLEEVARFGDMVAVLRDGILVAEVPATTPEPELVRLMVGREITNHYPRRREYTGPADTLLEVRGLTRSGVLHGISFQVHAGEVVGVAGLVGAGRTELMRAIAGADPYDSGSVTVAGTPLGSKHIGRAIRAGLGLVPEDRKAQGLVLGASVGDNIGYATMRSTAHVGLVDRAGQRKRAGDVAKRLRIRMRDLDQAARDLSGGNQQKIVFGRWMLAGSRVLLLDEPTRGVDVGARVEIYEFINQITAGGGAVVMVSSDLPEVLGMSDRILVMSAGHLAGELPAASATQEDVMALAVSAVGHHNPTTSEEDTP